MPPRTRTVSPAATTLRARLGWEPGILNGEGGKPKWMRWRTFEHLVSKHDEMVERSMQAIVVKFGLFAPKN